MNGNKIVTANLEALDKVKTIDELSNQVQNLNNEIYMKNEKIKEMGEVILKNLIPEKTKTGLKIKNRWGGENEIVFTNYGYGLQATNYGTNATSFKELSADEFVKSLNFLKNNLAHTKSILKEKNYETLKEFVKSSNLLIRNDKKKEVNVNVPITHINNYLLGNIVQNAIIKRLVYYEHQLHFDIVTKDEYGDKDNVRVDLKNPQLHDALIIEQIFDETKDILDKEIQELNQESKNYDDFISEIKRNFQAKIMFAELQKTK